jgi:hypothetical protein
VRRIIVSKRENCMKVVKARILRSMRNKKWIKIVDNKSFWNICGSPVCGKEYSVKMDVKLWGCKLGDLQCNEWVCAFHNNGVISWIVDTYQGSPCTIVLIIVQNRSSFQGRDFLECGDDGATGPCLPVLISLIPPIIGFSWIQIELF